MKLALLLALFPFLSFSQEVPVYLEEYPLDDRYKAGKFLIYDCQKKHYACVNQDGNNSCIERREEGKVKNTQEYDCAPLKSFQDKKSCLLKNYEVVEMNAWKRFCFPK